MKNKRTIMNEMKEGLVVLQNAMFSNVILSYCTHLFIFFLDKPRPPFP